MQDNTTLPIPLLSHSCKIRPVINLFHIILKRILSAFGSRDFRDIVIVDECNQLKMCRTRRASRQTQQTFSDTPTIMRKGWRYKRFNQR